MYRGLQLRVRRCAHLCRPAIGDRVQPPSHRGDQRRRQDRRPRRPPGDSEGGSGRQRPRRSSARHREALRALETARRGAQTARTAAINELCQPPGPPARSPRPHHPSPNAPFRCACGGPHSTSSVPPPNRPCAASRGGSRPSPPRAELQTSIRGLRRSRRPTCSTSPASGPSPPRRSTSPGHTPARRDEAAFARLAGSLAPPYVTVPGAEYPHEPQRRR